MAAGLGFKTFTTGEVLTAADTNGYLMQGVLVFASAAARDAAITSPQEGQFAYLKDTNVTTYYTGSAWANLDTTGMTNPMTTTGDTIYASSGSTPARLGIGSTGQVMTVAGGIPSWATPTSGGAYTSLASGSVVANLSLTSISGSYTDLYLVLNNVVTTVNDTGGVRINTDTTAANYQTVGGRNIGGTLTQQTNGGYSFVDGCLGASFMASTTGNAFIYYFPNYAQTTAYKTVRAQGFFNNNLSTWTTTDVVLGYKSTSAITTLELKTAGSNFASQGTYVLYGVK